VTIQLGQFLNKLNKAQQNTTEIPLELCRQILIKPSTVHPLSPSVPVSLGLSSLWDDY
jgi:hypothetical protein